ncbi:hypothetical protein RhiJN_25857 [Ceratobasidium sp. AG-Ba]|nr:hypothetical protein RhiJN_25857 [Ceratobasidium sp. AG-Ba]
MLLEDADPVGHSNSFGPFVGYKRYENGFEPTMHAVSTKTCRGLKAAKGLKSRPTAPPARAPSLVRPAPTPLPHHNPNANPDPEPEPEPEPVHVPKPHRGKPLAGGNLDYAVQLISSVCWTKPQSGSGLALSSSGLQQLDHVGPAPGLNGWRSRTGVVSGSTDTDRITSNSLCLGYRPSHLTLVLKSALHVQSIPA